MLKSRYIPGKTGMVGRYVYIHVGWPFCVTWPSRRGLPDPNGQLDRTVAASRSIAAANAIAGAVLEPTPPSASRKR